METLRYDKIKYEDLDIGTGRRQVRLQDGRVMLLRQIHIGKLYPTHTVYLQASNGAAALTAAGALQARRWVAGVTACVTKTFGTANGLTGLAVGDSYNYARWGTDISVAGGTETNNEDFANADMAIYPVNTDLIVSGIGGTFTAAGEIELTMHFFTLTHR